MITRERLRQIIFEADTCAGKAFDVVLIISVLFSVVVVMLESVAPIEARFGTLLRVMEWIFTVAFTVEYILRIYAVKNKIKYVVSFFGLVDLLAILPTYITLIVTGSHLFLTIKILRVLRIFRVFKLAPYIKEANELIAALKASRRRILVFLLAVLTVVVVMGALMYIIEGADAGFTSIPRSVYWAIVTLTTVGYGDISPHTEFGQFLAAVIMILGYSLIVVPTGFVSIAVTERMKKYSAIRSCAHCSADDHEDDAVYCKHCGRKL